MSETDNDYWPLDEVEAAQRHLRKLADCINRLDGWCLSEDTGDAAEAAGMTVAEFMASAETQVQAGEESRVLDAIDDVLTVVYHKLARRCGVPT